MLINMDKRKNYYKINCLSTPTYSKDNETNSFID